MKAFPQLDTRCYDPLMDKGMDLRDYFAAKAMVAIILHPQGHAGYWEIAAKDAYEMADAMMEARKK